MGLKESVLAVVLGKEGTQSLWGFAVNMGSRINLQLYLWPPIKSKMTGLFFPNFLGKLVFVQVYFRILSDTSVNQAWVPPSHSIPVPGSVFAKGLYCGIYLFIYLFIYISFMQGSLISAALPEDPVWNVLHSLNFWIYCPRNLKGEFPNLRMSSIWTPGSQLKGSWLWLTSPTKMGISPLPHCLVGTLLNYSTQ